MEIFYTGNRICSHVRLYGRKGQYSTNEEHMPPDHRKYIQWNADKYVQWAESVGGNTAVVTGWFLSSHKVEQQGYKACGSLMKLADRYSPDRLELACKRILEYTAQPNLRTIQAILKAGQDKQPEKVSESSEPGHASQYGITRGDGYYRTRRDDKC